MKKHSVLISGAGTSTAFALASRLRAIWGDRVYLVAADTNPKHLVTASLLADKFYQVQEASCQGYEKTIVDIIQKENIDTYTPLINEEIAKSKRIAKLLPNIDIWPSKMPTEIATDKKIMSEWANSNGLPVPVEFEFEQIDEVKEYFIKPRNGFGSKGARRIKGNELLTMKEETISIIVQEVCNGPEITMDSFYDSNTGYTRAIARERIETKSGVCTKARVFENSVFTELAKKVGIALNQCGTVCFQLMQSSRGWAITDLNLRPGAGTALTVATGLDVLAASFACRWGEPYIHYLDTKIPEHGIFVTRQYTEFVMNV